MNPRTDYTDYTDEKERFRKFREFSASLFRLRTGTVSCLYNCWGRLNESEQGCSEYIEKTNSEQLECVQTILVWFKHVQSFRTGSTKQTQAMNEKNQNMNQSRDALNTFKKESRAGMLWLHWGDRHPGGTEKRGSTGQAVSCPYKRINQSRDALNTLNAGLNRHSGSFSLTRMHCSHLSANYSLYR